MIKRWTLRAFDISTSRSKFIICVSNNGSAGGREGGWTGETFQGTGPRPWVVLGTHVVDASAQLS